MRDSVNEIQAAKDAVLQYARVLNLHNRRIALSLIKETPMENQSDLDEINSLYEEVYLIDDRYRNKPDYSIEILMLDVMNKFKEALIAFKIR